MPLLSVIMPVYNAEKYLQEAIGSILKQTYTDFEFIIINDGSTDGSEKIILSNPDPRIIYHKNEFNLGLIATLNYAIKLASGEFIARMDNDDIAATDRFEVQLNYLNRHEGAQMVCSPIIGISSAGKELDSWPADIRTKTSGDIRKTLPWENCIAHPTVLIEAKLLKKYLYSRNQRGSEDYDLWLRLTRDGVKIVKTPEVLLRYRIHNLSITQKFKTTQSPQIKTTLVKLRFFYNSVRELRINFFVFKTLFTIYKDVGFHLKTQIFPSFLNRFKWLVTVDPFKAYKQYLQLKHVLKDHETTAFLFLPYSHIGGAEKVHAQITRVIEEKKPFVFFTGLSNGIPHLDPFGNKAKLLNVPQALYQPFFSKRSERLIVQKINNSKGAIVLGSNSLFFYDLIPKLNNDVFITDLTHDFDFVVNRDYAIKNLANYLRCNRRIFISNSTLKRTKEFYEKYFVDDEFVARLNIIYNYVDKPIQTVIKYWQKPLKVLYVGRDTPEKRVQLIFDLASICNDERLPVQFTFVGDVKERKGLQLPNLKIAGVVLDKARLSQIYGEAHFILITSASEGFPLSLMEGMIHGCLPISTGVGDIPFHIQNGINGFVVDAAKEKVTIEMLDILKKITGNEFDLAGISGKCVTYAENVFSKEKFVKEYRDLFRLS